MITRTKDPNIGSHVFYSQLRNPLRLQRQGLTFIIEEPHPQFFYPCTPGEVLEALECLPVSLQDVFKVFVMRQPTRGERTRASVWGGVNHFVDAGSERGPALFLDAQNLESARWKRTRGEERSISAGKRGYVVEVSLESMRETVLFRTIPHHIGKYVEFLEASRPVDTDLERLWELFFARPVTERENFAHRYAEKWREKMRRWVSSRTQQERRALTARDGLNPVWFGL